MTINKMSLAFIQGSTGPPSSTKSTSTAKPSTTTLSSAPPPPQKLNRTHTQIQISTATRVQGKPSSRDLLISSGSFGQKKWVEENHGRPMNDLMKKVEETENETKWGDSTKNQNIRENQSVSGDEDLTSDDGTESPDSDDEVDRDRSSRATTSPLDHLREEGILSTKTLLWDIKRPSRYLNSAQEGKNDDPSSEDSSSSGLEDGSPSIRIETPSSHSGKQRTSQRSNKGKKRKAESDENMNMNRRKSSRLRTSNPRTSKRPMARKVGTKTRSGRLSFSNQNGSFRYH